MIDLTPLDVRKKKGDFRRGLRGYEPQQVDDFLDVVADRLDALVREHQAMVYSICWHYLHDRAAAEELAQEVFLTMHQSLGQIESARHLTWWLRRVTTNRCIDQTLRGKLRPRVGLDQAPEPAAPPQRAQQAKRHRRLAGAGSRRCDQDAANDTHHDLLELPAGEKLRERELVRELGGLAAR